MSDQTNDVPYYPRGPALLYVHAEVGLPYDDTGEPRTITQVDMGVPREGGPVSVTEARRERRILRALLEQAIWLLDQEEGQ